MLDYEKLVFVQDKVYDNILFFKGLNFSKEPLTLQLNFSALTI